MRKLPNTASKYAPSATIVLLLLVWEVVINICHVPSWIMVSPSQIISTLVNIYPLLLKHTATTLFEAFTGFILSIIIALIIAYILDSKPVLQRSLYPLLIFSQTIPLIVLAVLFTIWFGWGILPKVLIVILVCFFPIVINLLSGLNSVDPDKIYLFLSMGASHKQIFKMVKLPSAMPAFFSGLKISVTYSIMAAVIGEWMGAQSGLGYFMILQQKNFAIDRVLAVVVIICLLSFLWVKIIEMLEYLVVPWNRI